MGFQERTTQGVTIIDFNGRLTFSTGEELSRRITTLAADRDTKVVLNLEHVSYIDSAGLGAIVNAFTKLQASDVKLKFVKPSARAQHVLDITGIGMLVETFASETSAIESYDAVLQ